MGSEVRHRNSRSEKKTKKAFKIELELRRPGSEIQGFIQSSPLVWRKISRKRISGVCRENPSGIQD